ncbi:MAG: redox-regulated ATPase YchF [Nitrospirae bacterium]|nr:redox-regulated ATPase YchF [Nitrospirota bacterium]MBF0542128.1 redox-regulated ATPase YchF [Nitrospirota bacterium]
MKIAVTGFSNCGKTTVFNALTGQNIPTTIYTGAVEDPVMGVVKVPDERVDRLSEIFDPLKITYATIEFIDYMGIATGENDRNRKVFELFKDADALVEVVRAFSDDSVLHPEGSVDAVRDADNFEIELMLLDLELIEKRLQRMEESIKRGKKIEQSEKEILLKCKEALDNNTALRNITFTHEELKAISHLQFVSIMPKIIIVNISEEDIKGDKSASFAESISKKLGFDKNKIIVLCGKVEMEIAQLEKNEAKEFLIELGINEPAMSVVIKKSYELLGLTSFLTVGKEEVRAWTIPINCPAPQAAGKIHSDIEQGFIKAETISYDDFIATGSMQEARKAGRLRLEGKNYLVQSGDIIDFRFNVTKQSK